MIAKALIEESRVEVCFIEEFTIEILRR